MDLKVEFSKFEPTQVSRFQDFLRRIMVKHHCFRGQVHCARADK